MAEAAVHELVKAMDPEVARLFTAIEWVLSHRELQGVGVALGEYALQVGVSKVLSKQTIAECRNLLHSLGINAAPVTVMTLANEGVKAATTEALRHPLVVVRGIRHMVRDIQRLAALPADDDPALPEQHARMAKAAVAAARLHHDDDKPFARALADGRAIYGDDAHWLTAELPHLMGAVAHRAAAAAAHDVAALEAWAAGEVRAAHVRWRNWGRRHAAPLQAHVEALEAAGKGDASSDDETISVAAGAAKASHAAAGAAAGRVAAGGGGVSGRGPMSR